MVSYSPVLALEQDVCMSSAAVLQQT